MATKSRRTSHHLRPIRLAWWLLIGIMLYQAACASAHPPVGTPATAVTRPSTAQSSPSGSVPQILKLATTTSTQDSGLLDFLLPVFTAQTGIQVQVIAVGSGQALKLGEDGNVDVILAHSPALEEAFMAKGFGSRREAVMYNDFVIVGPADDPANLHSASSAIEAFQKLASEEATFVSRGDNSGTHQKELEIWATVGITPQGPWYLSTGLGMGEALTMAEELQAYILSDRATFLRRTQNGTSLAIIFQNDPILTNPYAVIAVNPARHPQVRVDLANQWIDWLISPGAQELIASFGVAEFGQPLFFVGSPD